MSRTLVPWTLFALAAVVALIAPWATAMLVVTRLTLNASVLMAAAAIAAIFTVGSE